MPESKKRQGHHVHHQPSTIPPGPRTKGRIIWAILLGIFGLLVAFFAAGTNYIALAAGVLIGALIGYTIGKSMENEAKKS
jgi:predicted phage tail protein